MSDSSMARYRVYYPEQEAANLPAAVIVEEQYPAFGIVSATEAAINELRRQYPVELLGESSPPPAVPTIAGAAKAAATPQSRPPYIQVIRFNAPVREEWLAVVEETDCKILTPIGSSTFVVRCPNKESVARLNQLGGLSFVRDYVPEVQLNPDSFAGVNSPLAAAATPAPPGALIATYFEEEDQKRAKRSLRRKKIRNLADAGATALVIDLTASDDLRRDVQTIITQPGLRSLQEQKLNNIRNDVARLIIADRLVTANQNGLGLTGRGEIVAVADTGLDTGKVANIHLDFQGRVSNIQSFPIRPSAVSWVDNPGADDGPADIYSGHGTHVCGSVLGSGAKAVDLGLPSIQGLAPEAELVFQAIEQTAQWKQEYIDAYTARFGRPPAPGALLGIPDDIQELFQSAYDQNARIHSNSWGGGDPGVYDKQCLDLDHFVWEHKDFLVVVAAGNDGADVNPQGGGIDAGSVTSPAIAKNCLTVGASENNRPEFKTENYGSWWPSDYPKVPFKTDPMTDNTDDIVAFSSRGPCKSPAFGKVGRRKPRCGCAWHVHSLNSILPDPCQQLRLGSLRASQA
jgi:serine protease AprX